MLENRREILAEDDFSEFPTSLFDMKLTTLYNLCTFLNYIRLFRPYFDKKSTRGNSFFIFHIYYVVKSEKPQEQPTRCARAREIPACTTTYLAL